MKRGVSILMVLFFGLGPLSAVRKPDGDARLPACCRRNGAHHCAMSDEAIARAVQAAGAMPVLIAPAHCPFYPGSVPATFKSCHAFVVTATASFAIVAGAHSPIAHQPALLRRPVWTHAGRGPPNPTLG